MNLAPATPVPAAEPPPAAPAQGWLRENIEAFVVALVLALIIKYIALEAFVIPTGSMAPTLYGVHWEVECPHCGYDFARGLDPDDPTHNPYRFLRAPHRCKHCGQEFVAFLSGQADGLEDCPSCGKENLVPRPAAGRPWARERLHCPQCRRSFDLEMPAGSETKGDKILVNKLCYRFRDPERFDVVVFKKPNELHKNYIKRLIGLPGETVQIRNGDIYIDGAIARKPDRVQQALWALVYDQDMPARDESEPAWTEIPGEARTDRLLARRNASFVAYNGGAPGDQHYDTADLRVAAEATAGPSAGTDPVAILAVRETMKPGGPLLRHTYEARVTGLGDGEGAAELVRITESLAPEGRMVTKREEASLVAARAHVPRRRATLRLSHYDNRLVLEIDGREALRYDYDADHADLYVLDEKRRYGYPRLTTVGEVLLGAEGPLTFEHVQVERDVVYYADEAADWSWSLANEPGRREFFVLGDNTHSSADSRRWGTFQEQNLIGRACMIFWPAWPLPGRPQGWSWRVQRIR